MFTSRPSYSMFRTLSLTTPHQAGEDVFALQTALMACGYRLPVFGADGDLGLETSDAIVQAQRGLALTVDGKAGGQTQRALALRVIRAYADGGVLYDALRGSVEHESSYRLGAYSVAYPNGSYDAGVTQRNTALTSPKDGFEVPASIEALTLRTKTYYAKFAGITPDKRRWALAQGAWNAPAFACYLAREAGATGVKVGETLKPSAEQRQTFEAYVASVSAYL